MNVIEAIRRKRAVRKYEQRPLPQEAIQTILYAGRRAQSSKNSQPWHFIAIQDHNTLMDLSKLGDFTGPLTNAAMAVAILTPDPTNNYWLMFDAGQAVAYMQLAALELGIGSCIVSLHRPETAGEVLGFPDDLELHAVLAFGYPADPEALEAPPRTGGRRATEEIAFYERWGNTSPDQG